MKERYVIEFYNHKDEVECSYGLNELTDISKIKDPARKAAIFDTEVSWSKPLVRFEKLPRKRKWQQVA